MSGVIVLDSRRKMERSKTRREGAKKRAKKRRALREDVRKIRGLFGTFIGRKRERVGCCPPHGEEGMRHSARQMRSPAASGVEVGAEETAQLVELSGGVRVERNSSKRASAREPSV